VYDQVEMREGQKHGSSPEAEERAHDLPRFQDANFPPYKVTMSSSLSVSIGSGDVRPWRAYLARFPLPLRSVADGQTLPLLRHDYVTPHRVLPQTLPYG
jgi:hypothetical protein